MPHLTSSVDRADQARALRAVIASWRGDRLGLGEAMFDAVADRRIDDAARLITALIDVAVGLIDVAADPEWLVAFLDARAAELASAPPPA